MKPVPGQRMYQMGALFLELYMDVSFAVLLVQANTIQIVP
jgi:hypothetical protein